MNELNKEETFTIEVYKICNLMRVHTDLVVLAIKRWSAILLFGTEFFIWQAPNSIPDEVKTAVLFISVLIMAFLTLLIVRKTSTTITLVQKMALIESRLEFESHMTLYDDKMEKHWNGFQPVVGGVLNAFYSMLLFVHFLYMFSKVV